MCEVMEKYINEAEIKATITALKEFRALDIQIIQQLKKTFSLTEDAAKEALQSHKN